MALAILDLLDFGETGYDLQVEIGTNTHFEIKLGTEVARRAGLLFVDGIFHQTPLARGEGGGDPLAPPQDLRLAPLAGPGRRVHAQLFSYKPGRRSPAVSDVVELPPLGVPRRRAPPAYAQSLEMVSAAAPIRTIAHRSLSATASISFDTILAEVLKIAQPIVANVLKAPVGGAGAANPAADIVAGLLKAVLSAMPGPPAAAPVAQAKSLAGGNRFNGSGLAEPLIFGIDDAIIAAAIGPIVDMLPKLANAAAQKDKERRAADQTFTSGILKDIGQRLLLDQVLEAQRQAALAANNAQAESNDTLASLSPEQLANLAALVARLPAQPVATGQSYSRAASQPAGPVPAPRAVLEPLIAAPIEWIGGRDPVFARAGRIALRFRFVVAAPAPAAPLPRALLQVTLVDDANKALRHEKTVRLTSLRPNSEIECEFEAGEIAHLPPGSRLTATAALRWPGKSGRTYEALGSTGLVLAGPLFVKAQGAEVGAERELADMRRWRAYWNKLWEAPTLDRSVDGKRRWKLDVDARYTVALGNDARNGVMETRHRPTDDAPDPDYALTAGRLKGGLEIGVAQLAQLRRLWDLPDLAGEVVTALADRRFLALGGGEAQRRLELKGRAGERGLVWAIPTFRLFDLALGRIAETDAAGQVTRATDETIQLPLPVGLRVLGLKSN